VEGDYLLSARVDAALAATFDAGALVLWADERTWGKLALERSPAGAATIVSVVTRGVSDDCNSWTLEEPSTWLRIARIGDAYAFHASRDGRWWELVRHFRLEGANVQVGFEAQSPFGDGLTARFSEISFETRTLADLRDGS
jgi:regulation of enolase protein 1 (concanavalin A-like superfamily)